MSETVITDQEEIAERLEQLELDGVPVSTKFIVGDITGNAHGPLVYSWRKDSYHNCDASNGGAFFEWRASAVHAIKIRSITNQRTNESHDKVTIYLYGENGNGNA